MSGRGFNKKSESEHLMKAATLPLTMIAILSVSGAALAQSTGASHADPNNERNQRMAPGNSGPADPATDTPSARVPTAPEDQYSAEREEGGADGTSSGESGTIVVPAPQYDPDQGIVRLGKVIREAGIKPE